MKPTERTPLIAGNWKMNVLPTEAGPWLDRLLQALPPTAPEPAPELLLCVPYTHLQTMAETAFGTPVLLGSQDVSSEPLGARTGEVAAEMLADMGVRYAIVGHSERRAYHHESDATVAAKAARAQAAGLNAIVCVGESREDRDSGRATEVVLQQLQGSLEGVDDPELLVVAYEPVWAIGTGLTATASDAQEMSAAIRTKLVERYPGAGQDVRVLYGGSMKPGNAKELLAQSDVDGGLIGGAALDVDSLLSIYAAAVAGYGA